MRGDQVVEHTLAAALEEISRVGYAALRVEDVAVRAGVNKTTVYRRWPSKEALVKAALISVLRSQAVVTIPDTGSIREDLIEYMRGVIAITSSPAGRTVVRLLSAERPDAEVLEIAHSIRCSNMAIPLVVLKRAQSRGELRADVDPQLFLDVLVAAFDRLALEGAFAETSESKVSPVVPIIDLLLEGALSGRPGRSPRGRPGTSEGA